MERIDFKEDNISKIPALEQLKALGFEYLSPDAAMKLRGDKSANVLLESVLRKQLQDINTIQVNRNKTAVFSEQNIDNGILALRNIPLDNGYVTANQHVYDLLTLGKAFEQSIDGDKKSFTLRYIDWEHPERNVFQVTDEFPVTRNGLTDTYRPDIVLFVNGIPLCVIECKRPDVKGAREQAISQHLRNQQEDGIRSLYLYSALLLAVGNSFGTYATTGTPEKFWSKWTELFSSKEEEKEYNCKLQSSVSGRLPTAQDRYIFNLCRPCRLLELMYNFTLFDAGVKKIARYQQYFAVKRIMERIRPVTNGKRQGGVIWHTQGSGKSLTMVMLAQAIASDKVIANPHIIMVTDRTDLDRQITGTFRKCGKIVQNAHTGAHLVELLESRTDAIVTTVINKFDTAVRRLRNPLPDADIFMLIDEAHRSQYREMAVKMDRVLPNACKIAFTGTPLMKKEKNTAQKFGGIINPIYSITQAVEDKAVVPLLYEGRMVPQNVHEKPIDTYFDKVCEDLNELQVADLKKKYSQMEELNATDQRLFAIAWDISEHYQTNWQGTGFKAMLVCPKKKMAVQYKKLLDEIGKVTSEVLITAPDDREGEESSYSPTDELVKSFWKKMMNEHGTPKRYEDNLISRFSNQEDPEILIVVDKLLTGFDEPKAAVMYLDRNLTGHTLLQAVSRVNRLCDGKEFGFIIDYYGVLGELNDVLKIYSDYDPEEAKVFTETLQDVRGEIDRLPQLHSELWDVFKTVADRKDLEAYAQLLRDEKVRHCFYEKLSAFASCLRIALSTMYFYKNTSEKVIQCYKQDLTMFLKLRSAVQLRYSDVIDYKQYEGQIAKLVSQHVESGEVQIITKLVNIFDKEKFEEEVSKVNGNVAKADTIASRTSKFITENMESDPAFYKKFSQMLKETIAAYQQGRIDEAEYLSKVIQCKDHVLSHTDSEMPSVLVHNDAAKAYFGISLEVYKRICEHTSTSAEDLALATALAFDSVILHFVMVDGSVLVDWQSNSDVIGQMKNDLEDYLIDEVKKKHDIPFTFDDMDIIIDGCVEVAKIWIR